jgi:hypothetical protein
MNRKHMTRTPLIAVSLAFTGAVLCAPPTGLSEDRDPALYVGSKKCKLCHKKEEKGNQWQKWIDGPHSKTFATLATDKAKATAAKLGIEDPQTSGKCLKCHSTAYHWTEEAKTDKVAVEEGVGCESCHGPGKVYKKKEIMNDRKASIDAGMVHPATTSCTKCHNDQNPNWDPEKYTMADGTKTGFDLEQAYEKIKHPNPLAKEE